MREVAARARRRRSGNVLRRNSAPWEIDCPARVTQTLGAQTLLTPARKNAALEPRCANCFFDST
jgi:hypothetical protein